MTVIRPSRGWISLNLRDLWEYRELLYFLTWRDVKVRYKQTVLGAAWAIIEWKMEDGRWRMESIFPSPLSPFHVQAWMFATPIAYPSSLLDEPWRTLYGINPMAGVVEGFRWALLGTETAPGPIVIVSALVAVGLLVSGAYYFRRMEKTFADVV